MPKDNLSWGQPSRVAAPAAIGFYHTQEDTIMTGRELKQWAAQVHDDAVIEVRDEHTYRTEWKSLSNDKVRAVHTVLPVLTMEHMCNEEDTRV